MERSSSHVYSDLPCRDDLGAVWRFLQTYSTATVTETVYPSLFYERMSSTEDPQTLSPKESPQVLT